MLFLIEATFAFVDVEKTKTAFWLDIPPLVKQQKTFDKKRDRQRDRQIDGGTGKTKEMFWQKERQIDRQKERQVKQKTTFDKKRGRQTNRRWDR